MGTIERIRIHRFHDQVALGFTGNRADYGEQAITPTLYLGPGDALALARELRAFASECLKCNRDSKWYGTRIIEKGKAVNESDGTCRRRVIP